MKMTIVDCTSSSLLDIALLTLVEMKKKMIVYPASFRIEMFDVRRSEVEQYLFLSSISTVCMSIYEKDIKEG